MRAVLRHCTWLPVLVALLLRGAPALAQATLDDRWTAAYRIVVQGRNVGSEQVTLVRAHENLVAAASANRVGASHGPEWAGGSVIAATQFPGFPVTLARAGMGEELIAAELDFAAIAEWYDVLPWREWLAGPQAPVARLIADELSAQSAVR